jgi:hypothetical protein
VTQEDRVVIVDIGQSLFRDVPDIFDELHAFPYALNGASWSSDIYSLGRLLQFVATGQEPVECGAPRNRRVVKRQVRQAIRRANPRLLEQSEGIADVIAACLGANGRVPDTFRLRLRIEAMLTQGSSIGSRRRTDACS